MRTRDDKAICRRQLDLVDARRDVGIGEVRASEASRAAVVVGADVKRQADPRVAALQLSERVREARHGHTYTRPPAARDTARAQGAIPALAAGGAERHNTW